MTQPTESPMMTSQENPMLTTDPLRRWKCESYCTCGSRRGHFELRDTGAWVLYTDAVADREAALKDLGDAMQGRIDALAEELRLARLKIAILQDPDEEPTAGNAP